MLHRHTLHPLQHIVLRELDRRYKAYGSPHRSVRHTSGSGHSPTPVLYEGLDDLPTFILKLGRSVAYLLKTPISRPDRIELVTWTVNDLLAGRYGGLSVSVKWWHEERETPDYKISAPFSRCS